MLDCVLKDINRGLKMSKYDTQSFCMDLISQQCTSPWFWRMVDLARGNLNHYTGPRTEDDFFKRTTRQFYSENSKRLDYISWKMYKNINTESVQFMLSWVFVFAPLILRYEQLPSVFSGTKLTEIKCYNLLLNKLYIFTNPKLKYDILTKMINNIERRCNLANPDVVATYSVARNFRANCDWACVSNDSAIQESRIQDLDYCMKNTNRATNKLKYAKTIINILTKRLENVIKTGGYNTESAIIKTCRDAYKYAAGASATNQDFVEWVWDVFDYKKIINMKNCMNHRTSLR